MEIKKLLACASFAWGIKHEDVVVDDFGKRAELVQQIEGICWLLGSLDIHFAIVTVCFPSLQLVGFIDTWLVNCDGGSGKLRDPPNTDGPGP